MTYKVSHKATPVCCFVVPSQYKHKRKYGYGGNLSINERSIDGN